METRMYHSSLFETASPRPKSDTLYEGDLARRLFQLEKEEVISLVPFGQHIDSSIGLTRRTFLFTHKQIGSYLEYREDTYTKEDKVSEVLLVGYSFRTEEERAIAIEKVKLSKADLTSRFQDLVNKKGLMVF